MHISLDTQLLALSIDVINNEIGPHPTGLLLLGQGARASDVNLLF